MPDGIEMNNSIHHKKKAAFHKAAFSKLFWIRH